MIAVRKLNNLPKNRPHLAALLLPWTFLALLASCNPTELTSKKSRSNVILNDGTLDGKAYVYKDSPSIIAGPAYTPNELSITLFLDKTPELVTINSQLTGNCEMQFLFGYTPALPDCIRSLKDKQSIQATPRKPDRTYIFEDGSSEFYQANTLYHLQKIKDTFLEKLSFAYQEVQTRVTSDSKSIPYYLRDTNLFWFKGVANADSKLHRNDYLTSYSQCDFAGNASFSPAGPELCFGTFAEFPKFLFVQDPTIIYHEVGHALVSIMMNLRNGTSASTYHKLRSNLGSFGYDEAGAINEGISDYFSFVMTKRTHIGEWALGKTANQSRPMSESDPLHIEGLDVTAEGRLSYPQYLLYDPNHPDQILEDVHYAGQIVGHYLVALTETFKTSCDIDAEADGGHDKATSYVTLLLAETLSELGDLNAKAVNNSGLPYSPGNFFNNLDPDNSYLWTQYINQTTFRRFFQVFSKNIYKYVAGAGNLCEGFDKNASEKLLDDYGLLLFETYNDNGNSTRNRVVNYASLPLTAVAPENRRKTVLVSKQLLELATKTVESPERVGFYIIDNRSDMEKLLKDLLFKGFTVPLSENVSSIDYNNNNIKVSPGEVVAVIPNLLNKSNSTMAGIQLLAHDWDHVDIQDDLTGNFKPCVLEGSITTDEGGESANTCDDPTEMNYKRLVRDPASMKFPLSAAAPICLVQLDDPEVEDSSKWVSQNEFRVKQGLALQDKDCLGYSTTNPALPDYSFNPHECLVRFLPGANDAFFSKIDSQKTFYESVVKDSPKKEFNPGNLLILEVNKWIPPGTKFRCRMRARFSNCSDCYTDLANGKDDYIDGEFNGSKPFKVINFDFEVND
ncbi:MAG TPA: hypothetical protein VNJ01_09685 [Bacteriovoracaceae bacterium]|nr:hypothetical protein [Bacteriovoracaceae bacterium]